MSKIVGQMFRSSRAITAPGKNTPSKPPKSVLSVLSSFDIRESWSRGCSCYQLLCISHYHSGREGGLVVLCQGYSRLIPHSCRRIIIISLHECHHKMYLMWVQKLIWLIRLKSLILSHTLIRVNDKLHISCGFFGTVK